MWAKGRTSSKIEESGSEGGVQPGTGRPIRSSDDMKINEMNEDRSELHGLANE